jgi:hypothetical protein
MPRRFLKPGLLTSRKWDSVSWLAQSFYVRLIPLVDDYGRYEAAPTLLRSHAFPLREDIRTGQVHDLCRELAGAQLAYFYKADGKEYLSLTEWTEKIRADKSKYPQYDDKCEQLYADVCKCFPSPSPSSDPIPVLDPRPPDPTRKRERVRLHGIPSSVAEVMAAGSTLNPVVNEQRCRDFWAFYEGMARTNANGEIFWVTAGENPSVITNWLVKLPSFGAQRSAPVKTGSKQAESPVWAQIKSVEALLADVKAKLQKLQVPNHDLYPAEYKKVIKERAPFVDEKAKLEQQLRELNRRNIQQ